MREGHPLPARIQGAPELALGLELYYNAFWELNTDRPAGAGLGPIPWSSLHLYAASLGLGDEEFDEFRFLLREMDDAYLEYHAKKARKSEK